MTASIVKFDTALSGTEESAAVGAANFHLSPRAILAVVIATLVLSAVAIMIVATIAPQGFTAGS